MAESDNKIPWYSWLILAFHLVWSVGIIWMTQGQVFNEVLKWIVTAVFILATVLLGIYDFLINKSSKGRDATPFDLWTIIHAFAGVVFGFWYVPLVYVLITVIWWEAFEYSVKGFGEKEVILNRVVDIGVALLGWLTVVIIGLAITGVDFPIANPVLGLTTG